MADPVRVALKEILQGDAQLKALATGGVFHLEPKAGAVRPYIIFHKASGVPSWAFDGPPMDRDVWLVKGVGPRDVVEDIDKRCKDLLNGADLDIEGKAHQDLRSISDVSFREVLDGERVDHVGAEYRVGSEYE